jgi:hypothetical protein
MSRKIKLIQGKKTRQSSRINVETRLKQQQAVQLRVLGLTHEAIAEKLGYATPSASYKAVMRELKVTAQDQAESSESLRTL